MNIEAREELKDEARAILSNGSATPAMRARAHLMMIEAYHAREVEALRRKAPNFDLYGSNFLAANGGEIDSEALAILERQFPPCTQRKIETGFSGWNSYGKHARFFCLLEQKGKI